MAVLSVLFIYGIVRAGSEVEPILHAWCSGGHRIHSICALYRIFSERGDSNLSIAGHIFDNWPRIHLRFPSKSMILLKTKILEKRKNSTPQARVAICDAWYYTKEQRENQSDSSAKIRSAV
ncbi:hypothetical protein [Beijerinckia indica]|uniref:hypothetical protein n=1 Tax=Beijerinckia indica TaxID=533 RepID=UPI0005A06CBA|nr:hypothetical protein [Beijerinckia indica]